MTDCELCGSLGAIENRQIWNRPLLESQNFVVIPSLGALVVGWVLIVPKHHAISMGALSDSDWAELDDLKRTTASALRAYYRLPVCAFEHGPSREGLRLGCGVDHAHLHLVPIDSDLMTATRRFTSWSAPWRPARLLDCRAAFEDGEGYLYVEQPTGFGHIVTDRDFESQVFRRAIATAIGLEEQFRWREYPQMRNVKATIQDASAWTRGINQCPKGAAA